MDGPVIRRKRSDHLICQTGWALLLSFACAYFAYRSVADIRAHEFDWHHQWWDTLTWLVWMVLAGAAISEVRCWRERALFAVLFLQFLLGSVFSFWTATFSATEESRWVSFFLWGVASLLSIAVLVGGPRNPSTGSQIQP